MVPSRWLSASPTSKLAPCSLCCRLICFHGQSQTLVSPVHTHWLISLIYSDPLIIQCTQNRSNCCEFQRRSRPECYTAKCMVRHRMYVREFHLFHIESTLCSGLDWYTCVGGWIHSLKKINNMAKGKKSDMKQPKFANWFGQWFDLQFAWTPQHHWPALLPREREAIGMKVQSEMKHNKVA